MGQRYEGTLIIQTNDYYSPVGSKVLTPVENPASSDDVIPGKGLYDSNGNYIGGSLVDGWPVEIDTEEGMDAFITLENVNRYAKYTGTSSGTGGPITPVNPIEIGDTLTELYYNEAVEPDLSLLDWSNAETTSADTRVLLIGQANSPKIYATKEAAWGGATGDIYTITRTDSNGLLWVSENARTLYGAPQGWVAENCKDFNFVVNAVNQQDVWGAYISKDGQWTGGTTSKYTSGQIYQVIQQGESAELKPVQY